jgi:hypothetical protein
MEGLGQLEKSNDIRNRTHDLPACSIVPQPKKILSCMYISLFIYILVLFRILSYIHNQGQGNSVYMGTLRNVVVYIKNYSVLVHNATTEFAVKTTLFIHLRFSLKLIMIRAQHSFKETPTDAHICKTLQLYGHDYL